MGKVSITVVMISRGRKKLLKKNMLRFYEFAKNPEEVEFIIILDDDDESINMFKTDEKIKSYNNIRLFVAPRIGFGNVWNPMSYAFFIAKGDMIVPSADDCEVFLQNWDEVFLQYRDKPSVVGWKARIAISRKAIDQDEFLTSVWKSHNPDTNLYRYAVKNNIYYPINNWYNRVQPRDKTWEEGRMEGWKLKDKSILDDLVYKEIDIYG